tara:strand:+ start:28738 stop:28959 length:222 start_codon:yes stop_codon:yes gene_type:complete
MYKDKLGNLLSKDQVVVDRNNNLYFVEEFDTSRDNFVKLRNSCVISYNKPENLIGLDSVHDLKLLCKNNYLNG